MDGLERGNWGGGIGEGELGGVLVCIMGKLRLRVLPREDGHDGVDVQRVERAVARQGRAVVADLRW